MTSRESLDKQSKEEGLGHGDKVNGNQKSEIDGKDAQWSGSAEEGDGIKNSSNHNLSLPLNESSRLSIDESVNLNDDLANESDFSESESVLSSQHRRGGKSGGATASVASFRNSIDAESSFLSSAYFQNFNSGIDDITTKDLNSVSPLGPNSIYELTIASDLSRERRRAGKSQVTLNGGTTTVYNLKTPTVNDIPPIQLEKLANKVKNDDIRSKLIKDIDVQYQTFDESYKALTADTLQKFIQQGNHNNNEINQEIESNDNYSIEGNGINDDEKYDTKSVIPANDTIPAVFSDPNFRLDDPRIFKQVIGDCNILPDFDEYDGGGPSKQNLANNNQLQDQLSHYLDLVEIDLIQEISKSSNSFFSTIEDIKSIQEQSDDCVEQFKEIMARLNSLDANDNRTGLNILNQISERNNIEYLESSIIQIKYVTSIFDLAKQSFNSGENAKCLNEIILVEQLLQGSSSFDLPPDSTINIPKLKYPLINISKLPALINLQNDLQKLKDQCSKGYIKDFNDLLIKDLRSHYKNVPINDSLNRMYYSVDKSKSKKFNPKDLNNSYQNLEDSDKRKLKDYVENLVKSDHLVASFQSYQDRIISEIKDIIKVNLPKSSNAIESSTSRSSSVPPESSQDSSNNSLSGHIKNLTPKEFEVMLVKIFCGLAECLRRLTVHQKTLLDLALSSIPATSRNVDVMAFDLTMAINKGIELTQLRLSKVINVRLEQIADLSLQYYLRFYSLCSTYLQECELINPGYVASGAGSSLNDWIRNHVNYFVHRFHLNNLKAIAHSTEKEVWKEVVDSTSLKKSQLLLDEIISYASFLESGGKTGFNSKNWMDTLSLYNYEQAFENSNPEPTNNTDDSVNRLSILDEKFMVPQLVLESIKQVRDYVIISTVFSHKASNIEHNILNYFKLMNSKTAFAVLNAGATRTAGLKHITTKHIALCIQVIEFNVSFLKHLEQIFSSISKESSPQSQDSNSNGNNEELTFAMIIKSYNDREDELCSKLVSIMYDRTLSHCHNLLKIDWSEPIKLPRQCHPFMETLVKETLTVNKVLSKYLPEMKYSLILLQIFNNYKKLMVECFCTQLPQFRDFNEKHSLLKDIDYFRVKLIDCPGYGNSGQVIWENVNALPTIEDTKMEEIMRHNIEGERQQHADEPKEESSAEKQTNNSLVKKMVNPKSKTEDKLKADENNDSGRDSVDSDPIQMNSNTEQGKEEQGKEEQGKEEQGKEEQKQTQKVQEKEQPENQEMAQDKVKEEEPKKETLNDDLREELKDESAEETQMAELKENESLDLKNQEPQMDEEVNAEPVKDEEKTEKPQKETSKDEPQKQEEQKA